MVLKNSEKYLKDGVNMVDFIKDFKDYSKKDNITAYSILAAFLTQSVKPTLTEDEKVILRNVDKMYVKICRNKTNNLYLLDNETYMLHIDSVFNHLFQFIQPRRRI